MGVGVAAPVDRRHRRRLETIEEVLGHALDLMAEEGVAGLSLGEIARRMGIRPPSLYVYFPSKHALYDALFQRGWELLLAEMTSYDEERARADSDLASTLSAAGAHMARWSMEHPAYAQLLFWRPVPGFEPSPAAYEPATRFYERGLDMMRALQERGLVRGDADIETALVQWTVLVSGVVSQQLSNAPDEPFAHGRFTTQLPELTAMFAAHYAAPRRSRGRSAAATPPGGDNERQR